MLTSFHVNRSQRNSGNNSKFTDALCLLIRLQPELHQKSFEFSVIDLVDGLMLLGLQVLDVYISCTRDLIILHDKAFSEILQSHLLLRSRVYDCAIIFLSQSVEGL